MFVEITADPYETIDAQKRIKERIKSMEITERRAGDKIETHVSDLDDLPTSPDRRTNQLYRHAEFYIDVPKQKIHRAEIEVLTAV